MSLRWSSDDGISQLFSDGTTESCSPEVFQQETKSNEKGEIIITSSELENMHPRAVAPLNAQRDKPSEVTPACLSLPTQGCGELCWGGCHCPAPSEGTELRRALHGETPALGLHQGWAAHQRDASSLGRERRDMLRDMVQWWAWYC